MLLATRCPHCETVFRLQQDQLALHGGLVRCGHCRQIFNAAESLVHEAAPQPEPAPAAVATAAAVAATAAAEPRTAAIPRLFVDSAPGTNPARADFRPGGWDMWAPWLDGGVDPSLLHNVHNVSADPLVPVPPPEDDTGTVRLTGTPQPVEASGGDAPDTVGPSGGAASTAAVRDVQTAEPSRSTDEPAPPTPAPHSATHDAREPRFGDAAPSMRFAPHDGEPDAGVHPPVTASQGTHDTHEPRFVAEARLEPSPTAPTETARSLQGAAQEPRFASDATREPFAGAPTDDDRPHFTVTRETRAPQRRGLLGGFVGGLVAAALTALLVVQLAWWQRETLMIYWPATQGWFRQLCAPLGCTVAPPRAIDGLRLDATDLRQLDGPRVLELKAPLTNRYRVALAYPSLELTLLDDTNHVTVRRVLAPRDYVRPGTPIEAGLPAGATQTMIVRLETNGAPASNFRVQIFYP